MGIPLYLEDTTLSVIPKRSSYERFRGGLPDRMLMGLKTCQGSLIHDPLGDLPYLKRYPA